MYEYKTFAYSFLMRFDEMKKKCCFTGFNNPFYIQLEQTNIDGI